MLDLHRLRVLHHFASHGSIVATASALGYSASAVSQQLATLEREVGASLLDRTARSAALTDAGHRLARHAAAILAAVEAAEGDLAATVGRPTGRIELCAVPSAAVHFAPALARLRGDHPELEVVVRQAGPAEAVARLRGRDADLAIVDSWSAAPPPNDVVREPLLEDRLVLLVPEAHPLARAEVIDLSRTAAEPWICAPVGEASRVAFDRVMGGAGIEPSNRWEFQGLATMVALVAHGVGIALVPALAVPDPPPDGVRVRVLESLPSRSVDALVRSSAQRRPALRAALSALREATPG